MRAMKCDRCGKFYEYYKCDKTLFKDAGGRVNGVMLIDMDLERKHQNRKIYDLCQDCMRELKYFLEGAQTNERL